MYMSNPKDPLIDIISTIADSFLRLKITEFTICEEQEFFIITSKQDWLDQESSQDVKYYFHSLIPIKGQLRALQGEVFLTAFYYKFYTAGDFGEYGNKEFFDKIFTNIQNLGSFGRVLIVSKEQTLPEEHRIKFERGQQPLSELENERKWLDIAIQQAKLNQ